MGTVFGFVASDVTSKIEILQDFRQGANGEQFETIEQMILYEEKQKLFDDPKYISASRTLLRLHRALCKSSFLKMLLNIMSLLLISFFYL